MTTAAPPSSSSDAVDYRSSDGRALRPFGWLTQTAALFVDAYRELNARKLFWITLILSLLVVASFAFVGINNRGISIFTKTWPGPWNTSIIPAGDFYKFLFIQLAIPWWLGLAATVLALISVGSIFPDFLTGGSIDVYLSKPIGRLRLFLTKYATGLLFVALQVFVFSAASFFVIGIRGGTWEWGIFLAVPLVVLFFSYLYCVCVLLGLVTRSTLASILVTLLLWFALFILNSADASLLLFKTMAETEQRKLDQNVAMYQNLIERQNVLPTTQRSEGMVHNYEFQRDSMEKQRQEQSTTTSQLRFWHNLIVGVKAPLPKTTETVALMNRWLIDPDPFTRAERQQHTQNEQRRQQRRNRENASATTNSSMPPPPPPPAGRVEVRPDDEEVAQGMQQELNGRSAMKLIGSSLAFEAVILGIGAFIFCRRDF